MSNVAFSRNGWDDYLHWQTQDKKTLKRINELLKDIQRSGLSNGIGKPEQLKYRENEWSRRIDHANRLVYTLDDGKNIVVLSCKGHYED